MALRAIIRRVFMVGVFAGGLGDQLCATAGAVGDTTQRVDFAVVSTGVCACVHNAVSLLIGFLIDNGCVVVFDADERTVRQRALVHAHIDGVADDPREVGGFQLAAIAAAQTGIAHLGDDIIQPPVRDDGVIQLADKIRLNLVDDIVTLPVRVIPDRIGAAGMLAVLLDNVFAFFRFCGQVSRVKGIIGRDDPEHKACLRSVAELLRDSDELCAALLDHGHVKILVVFVAGEAVVLMDEHIVHAPLLEIGQHLEEVIAAVGLGAGCGAIGVLLHDPDVALGAPLRHRVALRLDRRLMLARGRKAGIGDSGFQGKHLLKSEFEFGFHVDK